MAFVTLLHQKTEIEDGAVSERVLDVENLSIEIPVVGGLLHAVDNISIHVERGETLCIVGESGCGKSLTSLAIMDLLPKKASGHKPNTFHSNIYPRQTNKKGT